jgi:hypothetical protein
MTYDPDSKPLKPRQPVDGPLLRPCRSCTFYDENGSSKGVGFCTFRGSWHHGRTMPPGEGCSKQVPR